MRATRHCVSGPCQRMVKPPKSGAKCMLCMLSSIVSYNMPLSCLVLRFLAPSLPQDSTIPNAFESHALRLRKENIPVRVCEYFGLACPLLVAILA